MSGPVINLNIHYLSPQPGVTLIEGSHDTWVTLELSHHPAQVNLFLYSRADCDALIGAALAARDLLAADEPAHGENHIDNAGHATSACAGECLPGTCITCGATVSAAGVVTLAATA